MVVVYRVKKHLQQISQVSINILPVMHDIAQAGYNDSHH